MAKLRQSTRNLNSQTISEITSAAFDAYETASITPHISRVVLKDHLSDGSPANSIGIRRLINLNEFNDRSYIWDPYFCDVGRAIANGEKRYFHQQVSSTIVPKNVTILESKPSFDILTNVVSELAEKGEPPNTIIAPVYLLSDFYKEFTPRMVFECKKQESVILGNLQMKIFWSNKYAPLDTFLIFNSNAGEWTYIGDPNQNSRLWFAIGESERLGNVEYWIEVLISYNIINPASFAVIPVQRDTTQEEAPAQD
ncbi:hypothetical protein [Dehalogenimonas sp. 4OHTPN]|uniref:Uncharacterized protein n=1 Tax=Dehalogenimonas sp. 4OHTPN TaxID=3166643 RepID=A0AAU8GBV3_9CHLR